MSRAGGKLVRMSDISPAVDDEEGLHWSWWRVVEGGQVRSGVVPLPANEMSIIMTSQPRAVEGGLQRFIMWSVRCNMGSIMEIRHSRRRRCGETSAVACIPNPALQRHHRQG
jgi:hypothetical protein